MMKQARFAAFAALAFALSAVGHAAAQARVVVTDAGCDSGFRVVARGAPLSEVLRKVSEALDFQYRFEGDADPLLDIDVARQPIELVKVLAGTQNVSITQARDRKCPGRDRVVRVAVLPQGSSVKAGQALPRAGAPRAIAPEAQKAYLEDLAAHGLRLGADGREETIPREVTK